MAVVAVGTFAKGELPADLEYIFLDGPTRAPIDLTGFTARAVVRAPGPVSTEYSATVTDGPAGKVAVTWAAGMTAAVGPHSMIVWVGDGSNRFASAVLLYNVAPATAPAI